MAKNSLRDHILEKDFETTVIRVAKQYGWHVHGERAARTGRKNDKGKDQYIVHVKGDAGWPDLILMHRKRGIALFVELKRVGEKQRPNQREWQQTIEACGLTYMLIDPSNEEDLYRIIEKKR